MSNHPPTPPPYVYILYLYSFSKTENFRDALYGGVGRPGGSSLHNFAARRQMLVTSAQMSIIMMTMKTIQFAPAQ